MNGKEIISRPFMNKKYSLTQKTFELIDKPDIL